MITSARKLPQDGRFWQTSLPKLDMVVDSDVMEVQPAIAAAIDQIAPRLRRARENKGVTLAELARSTGISTSTLSRLESGQRRPGLELLLPITATLGLHLDEIVSALRILDPRVPQSPTRTEDRILVPLTRQQGEPRAYKMTIPAQDKESVTDACRIRVALGAAGQASRHAR